MTSWDLHLTELTGQSRGQENAVFDKFFVVIENSGFEGRNVSVPRFAIKHAINTLLQ